MKIWEIGPTRSTVTRVPSRTAWREPKNQKERAIATAVMAASHTSLQIPNSLFVTSAMVLAKASAESMTTSAMIWQLAPKARNTQPTTTHRRATMYMLIFMPAVRFMQISMVAEKMKEAGICRSWWALKRRRSMRICRRSNAMLNKNVNVPKEYGK